MIETHRRYNPRLRYLLKHKFKGCESLIENYSNEHQDLFVLSVLDGKRKGTYLEIGGWHPINSSNTYALEKYFNWRGISIELDRSFKSLWEEHRSNYIVFDDATKINYQQILERYRFEPIIDYLSCDIWPAELTLIALKSVPFDRYKFRIITFEHEAYFSEEGKRSQRESREFLSNLGYEMIVNDVGNSDKDGGKFIAEDWWVYPDLVDRSIIDKLKCIEEDRVIHNRSVYHNSLI